MKVVYTGKYHGGSPVMYRGIPFSKGVSAEASKEWMDRCTSPNIKEKRKRKVKVNANND